MGRRPLSTPGEAHRRYGRLADVLTVEQLERAEVAAAKLPPFTDDQKRALRTLIAAGGRPLRPRTGAKSKGPDVAA